MRVTSDLPNKYINRLIVDLSSVGRAAHYLGHDEEYGEEVIFPEHTDIINGVERVFPGSKVWVNGYKFAFENWLRTYLHVLEATGTKPFSTIIVKDGKQGRALRQLILPTYKGQRPSTAPELNVQYNLFIDLVCETILSLGGTVMIQDNVEADDVCAYLAKNLEGKKSLWTGDGDFLALANDDVDVYYKGDINPPLTGCPVTEWIPIYKALCGDTSDNMPGAKGFGKGAFLKFVTAYGDDGMARMRELIINRQLDKLAEGVADFKPLQKIIDCKDMVYACWECAQFFTHKVNTLRTPLSITSGYCHQLNEKEHHPDLHSFYGSTYLVDRKDFADFYPAIQGAIKLSPYVALDTEASTPPESDAWCEVINKSGKSKKQKKMFDSFGFELSGMSLTFGDNLQNTVYLPYGHIETDNCKLEQIKAAVTCIPSDMRVLVQNSAFELPLLDRTWGDQERDNGFRGFVPNVWDIVLMKQYIDENTPSGLKECSKAFLDYDQTTFEEATGGKKMNQLSGQHVADYACDDTIMTAALGNRYQLLMELEGVLDTWEKLEFHVQYAVAEAFNRGVPVNVNRLRELEAEDDDVYDQAWAEIRKFLVAVNWPGTHFTFPDKYPQQVREAFLASTGVELKTRARKPETMAVACKEQGASEVFCTHVLAEDVGELHRISKAAFTGEPDFLISSPKQMRQLLYGELGLDIRLHNPATQTMRDRGQWQGTPTSDATAVKHALKFSIFQPMVRHCMELLYGALLSKTEDSNKLFAKCVKAGAEYWFLDLVRRGDAGLLYRGMSEVVAESEFTEPGDELLWDKVIELASKFHILGALDSMHTVDTKRKLFYLPYSIHPHWKDGRLHTSLGQSRASTMRFTPNNPNVNQLPKKGEGVKFREIIEAEAGEELITPDYSGQELRLQADYSQDANFLACYIGDDLKDVHTLTGYEIALLDGTELQNYGVFAEALESNQPGIKQYRVDGKSTNFATAYGCEDKKLAANLVITIKEAGKFIKAKEAAFPGLDTWKDEVIKTELMVYGYTTTKMGVRRHLADKILSNDVWVRREAERQGINAKIQGSGVEQIKLTLAKYWLSKPLWDTGYRLFFPVHDELVGSTPHAEASRDLLKPMMEAPYADMVVPIIADFTKGPNFGQQEKF